MRREDEYRQLANSVRERAGDEESAESAVGNFGGYLRASSRSIGNEPSAEHRHV